MQWQLERVKHETTNQELEQEPHWSFCLVMSYALRTVKA